MITIIKIWFHCLFKFPRHRLVLVAKKQAVVFFCATCNPDIVQYVEKGEKTKNAN
jgi:hypothetical protein